VVRKSSISLTNIRKIMIDNISKPLLYCAMLLGRHVVEMSSKYNVPIPPVLSPRFSLLVWAIGNHIRNTIVDDTVQLSYNRNDQDDIW